VKRRTLKPTRIKLVEINDVEARHKLEMLFEEYDVQKQISVEKHRLAVKAQAEAQISLLKTQQLQQDFLAQASEHFDAVAKEPVWFIYRKDDEITLESVFTERTQRNIVRAQMQQLDKQIDEGDDRDMFEDESGDEDKP
jgi:hypothetical protein